jgi:hypothetical protein
MVRVMDGEAAKAAEKVGAGAVRFSWCFSWESCFGFFIQRTRQRPLRDRYLDDPVAFGVGDGAVVEVALAVEIPGTLRLLIPGRDTIMGNRKDGDRDSGLERWEELQQGTWQGTEEIGKNLWYHRGVIPGLEVIVGGITLLLGEVIRVRALLDTRAQDLDRHHGGRRTTG